MAPKASWPAPTCAAQLLAPSPPAERVCRAGREGGGTLTWSDSAALPTIAILCAMRPLHLSTSQLPLGTAPRPRARGLGARGWKSPRSFRVRFVPAPSTRQHRCGVRAVRSPLRKSILKPAPAIARKMFCQSNIEFLCPPNMVMTHRRSRIQTATPSTHVPSEPLQAFGFGKVQHPTAPGRLRDGRRPTPPAPLHPPTTPPNQAPHQATSHVQTVGVSPGVSNARCCCCLVLCTAPAGTATVCCACPHGARRAFPARAVAGSWLQLGRAPGLGTCGTGSGSAVRVLNSNCAVSPVPAAAQFLAGPFEDTPTPNRGTHPPNGPSGPGTQRAPASQPGVAPPAARLGPDQPTDHTPAPWARSRAHGHGKVFRLRWTSAASASAASPSRSGRRAR